MCVCGGGGAGGEGGDEGSIIKDAGLQVLQEFTGVAGE